MLLSTLRLLDFIYDSSSPPQVATLLCFDHQPKLRFIAEFLPHQLLPFSSGLVFPGVRLSLGY
ncbi:hypothetical protein kac65v162_gp051 [Nodularia phage vB_NspS-kac65v162]|uniref:Uncharacterized protein n=3 Tax=Ravarandavirus kac65v151 TaxID=2845689 RepID=A0A482MHY5_9CAUD|nr:hypothetical protein HWC12_gp051 [Nodularia phage vB_NspS-kac65v151]QBQ73083.1 hypothetical protein kac65v151_gp051 [Nodularia phage vB_NspS-kac65v151]QBQ73289.1 hypothetical protein kac65v161_gp051 [Nodularia phage vB_NspS-kac65v161]QBQ73495.1 hypothetical protein kac65v162_gp051 [Nodularia phage vB_NspS-kac65v162]